MSLRKKIYSIFFLSSLLFFPTEKKATEIGDYLKKGEDYYRTRDYKNSVIQFKNALTMNPSSKKALLGFAKSSFVIGEKKDAFESYRRILELESKNRDASLGLVNYYLSFEKFEEALKILNPVLDDDPYDPDALVALSQIYLKTGKKELALKKLEEAKRKTVQNKEFYLMLSDAYIATGKFSAAEEILEKLLNDYPNYPEAYFVKASLKVKLASLENYETRVKLIEDTYVLLKNALSIDPFFPSARNLLARVCLYQKKYDEAKSILEQLTVDFRKDFDLKYLSAYVMDKTGDTEKATKEFNRILDGNELDDIARFYAEEFSIKNLKEYSPLRSTLSEYRMERVNFDKRNYIYADPNFHLIRSKILNQNKKSIRSELLDYYFKKGHGIEFIKLLIKIRNDDPTDFKIQNRLENALKKQKESLSYKEGFISLDSNGVQENFKRNVPEVFLFDVFPEEFLDYKPNAAKLINRSLRSYLSYIPSIRVIYGKEEKEIREEVIAKSQASPYTDGAYFYRETLGAIDVTRKDSIPIRFLGYGSYRLKGETLSIKYFIYDRETGKNIAEFKLTSSGRNYLGDLTIRLAQKILSSLPIWGKIIKVKSDSVIVNLGGRDGIRRNQKMVFEKNGVVLGEGTVQNIDGLICEVIPDFKNWQSILSVNDNVTLKK